jgi:hypothetical protein
MFIVTRGRSLGAMSRVLNDEFTTRCTTAAYCTPLGWHQEFSHSLQARGIRGSAAL